MKIATVADLIAALQTMPQDAPIFGYSETHEEDNYIEVVELFTPSLAMQDEFDEQIADGEDFPMVYSPHYCQGDSYASIHWANKKKLCPIVYVRESTWQDRDNMKNNIRKENVVCLTADM